MYTCNPSAWEAETRIMHLRAAWATLWDPVSKQTNSNTKTKVKRAENIAQR